MKALICMLLLTPALFPAAARAGLYEDFLSRFSTDDGRIVDFYQGQASHSEGQGYAMLLAASRGDRPAFDRFRAWTQDNLQVRGRDRLLAWKWGRRTPDTWAVIDENNATDGDVLTAMALIKAGEAFGEASYLEAAREIIGDIRRNLVVERGGRLCLLPGYHGFMEPDGVVLNPSYFLFSGFRMFGRHDDGAFWEKVRSDALALLRLSLGSSLGLPPDWVRFDGNAVEPAPGRPARFGYDAIRVPLYLAWDHGLTAWPELPGYLDLVERLGYVPRWVDLEPGAASLEPGSGGMHAVLSRAARDLGRPDQARVLAREAERRLASDGEARDYYSWALMLLSSLEVMP